MADDNIWFVIPAYNEAGQNTIATSVELVRSRYAHVVVVDDHSTDHTGDLALLAGAHVCRHPVNLGQGAALMTGIEYALSMGANVIVTFDADGQHSVDDASAMIGRLRKGDVDAVLGSRFLGSTVSMPTLKVVLLKAATLFTRLTTGLNVTDTHNGLRAFSQHAAERIQIKQNRMAHASEILHQIAELNLRYVEFPNTVVYTDYSKAKGQRVSGAFAIIADLLIGRLSR